MRYFGLALSLITGGVATFGQETPFAWPNGAKAAVCLTHDDGSTFIWTMPFPISTR